MSEYGEIVRVYHTYDKLARHHAGYTFVSEDKPLEARQYCTYMTLARGRVLYEVWDTWNSELMGHFIPYIILEEAKAYRQVPILPPTYHAMNMVRMQYPRMLEWSVKRTAEDVVQRTRSRPITKRTIEDCAVTHALWKYTSAEFRLFDVGQDQAEVLEMIKPRMREVVESWMPLGMHSRELLELWERQELLDADDGEGKGRKEDMVFTTTSLGFYGGLEMMGNVSQRSYMLW